MQVHTIRHNAGGAPAVAGRILAGVLKNDLKRDFKAPAQPTMSNRHSRQECCCVPSCLLLLLSVFVFFMGLLDNFKR